MKGNDNEMYLWRHKNSQLLIFRPSLHRHTPRKKLFFCDKTVRTHTLSTKKDKDTIRILDGTRGFIINPISGWIASMLTSIDACDSWCASSTSRIVSKCIIIELHWWNVWTMVERSTIRTQSISNSRTIFHRTNGLFFSYLVVGSLFS